PDDHPRRHGAKGDRAGGGLRLAVDGAPPGAAAGPRDRARPLHRRLDARPSPAGPRGGAARPAGPARRAGRGARAPLALPAATGPRGRRRVRVARAVPAAPQRRVVFGLRRRIEVNERDLRAALVRELESDPEVDSARIAVAVENDAVTLGGRVRSFPEKLAALRAAERVRGVRAVADELVVVPPEAEPKDDVDIAKEIVDSLRWNVLVPRTVKVEVHDGR